MVDKVKPLKIENPATGGTQTDMFPTETNPAADYIATKGIAFENNDGLIIDAQSGELGWKDSVQTTFKKFNDLGGQDNFSYHLIKLDESVTIKDGQHMLCLNLEVDGFLDLEGSLVFI